MRIKITAQEDYIQGGYGWIVETINGKPRFNYDSEEYFTAQGKPGDLLAHDILEHSCRVDLHSSLDELAALGAIWANRDWEFHKGYRDSFAFEIGEQIAAYLDWAGDDIDSPCSSVIEDSFSEHYDNRIDKIEGVVVSELALRQGIDEDDLEIDWKSVHKLTKSYLAKGCNEVWRKELRYKCDFNYRFKVIENTINNACADIDPEQASYMGTAIYITFTYKNGVEKVTIYRQAQ